MPVKVTRGVGMPPPGEVSWASSRLFMKMPNGISVTPARSISSRNVAAALRMRLKAPPSSSLKKTAVASASHVVQASGAAAFSVRSLKPSSEAASLLTASSSPGSSLTSFQPSSSVPLTGSVSKSGSPSEAGSAKPITRRSTARESVMSLTFAWVTGSRLRRCASERP